MSKIKPLRDKVVIQRLEDEAVSAGGIVLPDSATEKPSKGKVLAVGPGQPLDDGKVRTVAVSEGQIVIFGQYAGSTVKIDGEELLILGESDILGILE